MFKKRLKELRIERNITQEELAKEISMARSSVAGYENGSKSPSMETLIHLAELFNVTTDYLLGVSNIRNHDMTSNYKSYNFLKVLETNYNKLDDKHKKTMTTVSMTLLDNLLEQQKSNKYTNNPEVDEDILKELNSYRVELESKKKLSVKDLKGKKNVL